MFAYNSLEAMVTVNSPKSQTHAESFLRSLTKALRSTRLDQVQSSLTMSQRHTPADDLQSLSKSPHAA